MFADVMRNGGGPQMTQSGSHVTQIQLIGGGPYGMRFDRIGNSGPVFVAKMHRRSKARAAGVEIGDVILSVNGHDCSHATADYVTELVSRISSTSPDLVLRLSRGGIYSLEATATGDINDNGFSNNTRHHQHQQQQQQQQHKPYHASQQQQQQQQQFHSSYPPYMSTTTTTTTATSHQQQQQQQQHTGAQRFPQSGGKLQSSMISSGNGGHANQYSKLTTMMSMTSPQSAVRRASFQSDVEDVDGTGTSTRRHVTALVLPPTSGERAHVVLNSQSSHRTVSSVQSTNYDYHNDESDVELAMTHRRGHMTNESHVTTTSRIARPATAPPPSEVTSSSDVTSWQYSRPTCNQNNSFDGYQQQPLLQPSRVQNNESRNVTSGFSLQQSESQRGPSAVAFGTSSNAATGSTQKWKPVLWQPSIASSPGVTHQSARPDVVNNANVGNSFLLPVNSNAGHRRASDADAWNKRPSQFYSNESTTTTADVAYQTPRHAPTANLNQLQLPLSTPRDRHSVDIVFGRESGPANDHHVSRDDNEVVIWSSKPAVESTPSTVPAKNNLPCRPQSAAAGYYQPPVSTYNTAAFDADYNGGNSANFYPNHNFRPQEAQSTYPVNVAVDDFNDFEPNFADRSPNAGNRVTASIGPRLDQQASRQQSWQGTDRPRRRSEQLSQEEDFRQYQQRSQTLPRQQQPRFEKPEVVQAAPTSAFPLQSGRRQSAPVADPYVTPSSHYLSHSGFVDGGAKDLLAPIPLEDYGLKRKKLYADSSFYEDADRVYPTIEEQIKMARKVAQLLMASHSTSGRGQQMFVKRQQLADQWTTESIAGQPFYPRQRRPAQRPPSANGWLGSAQNQAAELAELDRLRNCAEKTRHDIVPPVVGAQIAAELQRTSATGNTMAGRMFARRRERSERYVVPEVSYQRRPEPPPTAAEPRVPLPETVIPPASAMRRTISQPEVNMMPPVSDGPLPVPRLLQMIEMPRAAMTPWEAAAQFEGRVEPAFDHLVKYRQAARVAWTAPRDDDYVDEQVDGSRGRARNGARVDGGSRNTAVSNVDYQTDVEMDSYYSHHKTNQTPTSRRARSACPTPVTSQGRRQMWTPTAGAYSRPVPAASTGFHTTPHSYPSPSTPASAAASWSRATTPANPVSPWSGDYGDAYRPSTNSANNRYSEYDIGQRQPHFGYQLQS